MILSMHKATIKLLENTTLDDWKRLAEECDLNTAWIRQLIDGTIKEPGANKLQRLFLALGGKMADL